MSSSLLLLAVSSTAAPVEPCPGDCNADGSVSVDEVVRLSYVALGITALGDCAEGDADGNGQIAVDELVTAVRSLLTRCTDSGPTPTPGSPLDVTGRWVGTVINSGISYLVRFDLVQSGTDVTGFYEAPNDFEEGTVTGIVVGPTITKFQFLNTDPDCPGKFDGIARVEGERMTFDYSGQDCDGRSSGQGTATRVRPCNGSSDVCCGNQRQQAGEECDGFDTPSCQELGFDGGSTDCIDCHLDSRNCFSGGQCVAAGECGDPECLVFCPGEGFVTACLSDVCIVGSCACTDDFDECCELAGGSPR